ncbi:M23 family metallopeptidase [Candidatus Bipolaricaulota bacterium]|nr:M23 family metallopeptidase [Candidatus Bipolaricaulota bacterium]
MTWIALVLVASSSAWGSCPKLPIADISSAETFATDEKAVFQFPLASMDSIAEASCAVFCAPAGITFGPKDEVHTAEDYRLPAGTPVYAMADGQVSFSGRMDGYGWLIVVDHPQANLYSLYGHLSPSRWHIRSGSVAKGALIGYLGDADENGGTAEHPMRTHLHFGVRAGQRADYPGKGEWRWQAGWVKPCPTDVGWLHPSGVIVRQQIPPGGFPNPQGGIVEIWGSELLFAGVYLLCGIAILVFAIKKNQPILLVIWGVVLLGVAVIFMSQGMKTGAAVATMASILLVLGSTHLIRALVARRAQVH